ncbi:MAG TPA: hypothetical protein DEA50_08840, partial [Parvularcula sp.]|nr:hypothetical protein [Parvularcula sp.]
DAGEGAFAPEAAPRDVAPAAPATIEPEAPEPAAGASWREPEPPAPKTPPAPPPDIVPAAAGEAPKKGWWRKALGQ